VPRTYQNPRFEYRRCPDQEGGATAHHPVVVVGAGLVGLTAAVDLASRGVPTLLLDDDDTVSFGSRAICFAQRSLEIADRLGIGERIRAKGITWNRGKVFLKDREIYAFDLLPEPGHAFPAFVNLQQYYVEEWLVERARELGLTEIRWRNRVVEVVQEEVAQDGPCVRLTVETPDGPYALTCDFLLACDGARSQVRRSLGLEFAGQVFQDRFLIADVVMKADFPTERWFWFDPPFHPGRSVLLHRQADDVWRIDFQLGPDADPEAERQPERVLPRLRAMLGERDFELEWVSVYTFQCRRLERFRHGRVFFLGDAAHQVSPFGARGGNGGMQDADNLGWKLAAVLRGEAPEALLDSYDAERVPAADENILHSTRSTDFITPKNAASRAFRDAVLELAEDHPFARRLVNSGRLSLPCRYAGLPLASPDDGGSATLPPGAPCPDAPVLCVGEAGEARPDWLLRRLGDGFTLLVGLAADPSAEDASLAAALAALADRAPAIRPLLVAPARRNGTGLPLLVDSEGLVAARCGLRSGAALLFRPDRHLAARWAGVDPDAVRAAWTRALAADRLAAPAREAVAS
jgi:3-(3-hydroxy-phenyl)propionate hydroxylase